MSFSLAKVELTGRVKEGVIISKSASTSCIDTRRTRDRSLVEIGNRGR